MRLPRLLLLALFALLAPGCSWRDCHTEPAPPAVLLQSLNALADSSIEHGLLVGAPNSDAGMRLSPGTCAAVLAQPTAAENFPGYQLTLACGRSDGTQLAVRSDAFRPWNARSIPLTGSCAATNASLVTLSLTGSVISEYDAEVTTDFDLRFALTFSLCEFGQVSITFDLNAADFGLRSGGSRQVCGL